MQYATLLAMAMASAANAQITPTPTSTQPAPTSTTAAGPQAGLVDGEFVYLGCFTGDFEGFYKKGASSPSNSPDSCGRLCDGSKYFGVYADWCFCSEKLSEDANKVDDDVCSTVCPGDDKVTCGGLLTPARSVRRQYGVPPNVALSVYIAEGNNNGNNNGDYSGNNNSGNNNNVDSNNVIDSNNGNNNGDTNSHNSNNNNNNVIINGDVNVDLLCHGDWCAPKDEHYYKECVDCPHYRVVCWGEECKPEVCPPGEDYHRKVVCESEECVWSDCHKTNTCEVKVECQGEECKYEQKGEEKKYVCQGEECGHAECSGPDCYTKEVCVGVECKTETQGVPSYPPSVAPSGTPECGTNCPPSHVSPPITTPPPYIAGSSKMTAGAGLAALVAAAVFLL